MRIVPKLAKLLDGTYAWYEKKMSWNTIYYSFDRGDSWHKKLKDALEEVRVKGDLVTGGAENYAKRGGHVSYTEK